ncbi:glycosyl hydrolase family 28-related protein [Lactiplantibacillus pentosus]
MISTITLDTYKQQISSGDAFNLSDSFNGRVGDEQVPLVVQFKERGLAQQFEDGLVPFMTGFVGSLDENDQVTAETGEAVSYVGTSDDIVGLGRVKMNLPGTMFPQEGYFYGFLGLKNADGKRVTTFNVWFHVYNGNPDMFVNKAPFRTELQKVLDTAQSLIDDADGDLTKWKQKLTDLFSTLSAQGADTVTLLTTLQTQIKQSNLFTKGQMDELLGSLTDFKPTGSNLIDKLNNEFNDRGVNVKWFGAVGDGKTDNVDAINAAIKAAQDNGGKVYFPSGIYLTSGINIVLKNITIAGEDRWSTSIVSNQTDAVFDLKSEVTISDIAFKDTTDKSARMLTVSNTDTVASYWTIRLERLNFSGNEFIENETGKWGLDAIYFDLDKKGLWDVTINDVICNWVHNGLTINTQNSGWLTDSYFNNILVKGFSGAHTAIISTNNTSRQISQSVFSNLTAQVLYQTALDAIGFIVSGVGNDWNNLRLFSDGKFSGKAIQLKYCGGAQYDSNNPSFGYGSSANNSFVGGCVEGTIDDPDGIRSLQHFDNLRLQITDDDGKLQEVNINDTLHTNLLSRQGIADALDVKSTFMISHGNTFATGTDQYGRYKAINTGANSETFAVVFTQPDEVLTALKGQDQSLGIRWRDMTGKSSLGRAYLRANETAYSGDDLLYTFKNPNITDNDMHEYAWIYRNNDDYFDKVTKGDQQYSGYYVSIQPNSSVRIYDCYLVAGRSIDFSRVTNTETVNYPLNHGGRNYIQNGNTMLSVTNPVENQATKSLAYPIDINDVNWLTERDFVLSVDINIDNYKSDNVTSRLAAWASLILTFEDSSIMELDAGVINMSAGIIRDRYSQWVHMPNKKVTKAVCQVSTANGFTADYFQIGRPQLETGTVAHDFIPYITSSN